MYLNSKHTQSSKKLSPPPAAAAAAAAAHDLGGPRAPCVRRQCLGTNMKTRIYLQFLEYDKKHMIYVHQFLARKGELLRVCCMLYTYIIKKRGRGDTAVS